MASKILWSEQLERQLARELEELIEQVGEPIIEEAIAKVRAKMRDQVGVAAVRLARSFDIEELADRVIITVRLPEGPRDGRK